jgi:NAD-dependent deacetylase
MSADKDAVSGTVSMDSMVREAADLLRGSVLAVASTGAGMSRESGIRTFRGEEGFWKQYRAEDLASVEGIRKDPALVWEWYLERLRACDRLQPHMGYRALVTIQDAIGRLPLITQNVDGLNQKAGIRDVIELHGSLRTASCLEGCGRSPVPMTEDIFGEMPPRCPCGSVLRPDVVLFGENLPEQALKRAFRLAESCDSMLVVGTSMVVYPAAAIPIIALRNGARVIEINVEETPLSHLEGVLSLRGTAGAVLSEIAKAVCEE